MSNRGPILVQTVFCPSPPVSCLLSPGFWGSQPLQIWRTACCIWLWTLGTPDLSLSLPLTVLCGSGQIIILLCASVSSIYKENTGLLTRVTGSSTLSNVVSSAGVGALPSSCWMILGVKPDRNVYTPSKGGALRHGCLHLARVCPS